MKVLIIGGTNFFGKRLVQKLIQESHDVSILTRGNKALDFKGQFEHIKLDRLDKTAMGSKFENSSWDLIYDQVCYDYQTAKDACEIFNGKVKHYVFTSSQSVYEAGAHLKEADFNPEKHSFEKEETAISNYGEAKRQAEVGFARHAEFKTTYVRFPIVHGVDDYTQRLDETISG